MDTGTVISGTMRAEDLIPAFVNELSARAEDHSLSGGILQRDASKSRYASTQDMLAGIEEAQESYGEDYYGSDQASYDLDWLFEALNSYAPGGHYFGAHPGDGADYGYWAIEED